MLQNKIANLIEREFKHVIDIAIKVKTRDDMIYTYGIMNFTQEKDESNKEFIESTIHEINDAIITLDTRITNYPDSTLILELESASVRRSEITRTWAEVL